jgi:hypothetical protein
MNVADVVAVDALWGPGFRVENYSKLGRLS